MKSLYFNIKATCFSWAFLSLNIAIACFVVGTLVSVRQPKFTDTPLHTALLITALFLFGSGFVCAFILKARTMLNIEKQEKDRSKVQKWR